jgi:hypothetical protein
MGVDSCRYVSFIPPHFPDIRIPSLHFIGGVVMSGSRKNFSHQGTQFHYTHAALTLGIYFFGYPNSLIPFHCFRCNGRFYSLTHSWSWALLGKLAIVQPLKKFPAFYGTRRFITVFTRSLQWSLSWARSIQFIPSYLSKIHFNIVHLPTSWSSQWSLSFWLSHQYPAIWPSSKY